MCVWGVAGEGGSESDFTRELIIFQPFFMENAMDLQLYEKREYELVIGTYICIDKKHSNAHGTSLFCDGSMKYLTCLYYGAFQCPTSYSRCHCESL